MPPPHSDRRVVTVLFADIEGFTTLANRLDPERVTELLNEFFGVLSDPVYRCGGVVDKYMGDAVMALFGAPVAHEDDAERAVSCGLEMQRAARNFAGELTERTGIRLAVRIGINTGLVVAGAVGSGTRQDYTVIGDAVNVAQRLEGAAASGSVYVGEATYKAIRERFDCEAIGPLTLKGVPEPVAAYRAIGIRPIPRREFRERAPLVGRTAELIQIQPGLEAFREGHPHVIGLVGVAGIGKSRLAREVQDRIRRQSTTIVIRVRCPSYGQVQAMGLPSSVVSSWLGLPEGDGAEGLEGALRDRAAKVGYPDPDAAAALVATLLGQKTQVTDQLAPRERRDAAFMALNEMLVAQARIQPLLISLDHLQWADSGSIEWLHSFLDRLGDQRDGLPVLVMHQSRPCDDKGVCLGHDIPHTRVELMPLPADEQRALLAIALGLPRAPALWPTELYGLAEQLLERSEGNPLYLWELVKGLVDSKILLRTQSRWEVTRSPSEADLPPSIQAVVSSRLDGLPGALRECIQIAAVIGRHFSRDLLAGVYPGYAEHLIQDLIDRDFFHRREDQDLAFNQAIIQEVAYESLLLSARRDLHRRTGEVLETLLAGRAGDAAERLAFHFSRAQCGGKAARYLGLCGWRALRAYANDDALSAFSKALAHLPADASAAERVDILCGLAEVEAVLGHYTQAQAHAQEALSMQTDPRGLADLHCLIARNLDRQGAYQEARKRLEQAIEDLKTQSPEVVPRLLLERSWIDIRSGHYDQALALAHDARARLVDSCSASTGDLALAHNAMGVCYYRMNDWDSALVHHGQALTLRTQTGDLMGIADALHNLGLIHYQRGDWQAALDHYHRGLTLYERLGDVAKLLTLELNLGTLKLDMGQVSEATAHFERTQVLAERTGNIFMRGMSHIVMGNALAAADRYDEATDQLSQGLELLERIEALEVQPEAHQILGRVLVARGQHEQGRRHLERGLELAEMLGDRLQRGIILRHLATLAADEGHFDEAAALIERSRVLLVALGSKLEVARTVLANADLCGRRGERAQASQLVADAIAAFEEIGAELDRLRACERLERLAV